MGVHDGLNYKNETEKGYASRFESGLNTKCPSKTPYHSHKDISLSYLK